MTHCIIEDVQQKELGKKISGSNDVTTSDFGPQRIVGHSMRAVQAADFIAKEGTMIQAKRIDI